MIELVGASKTEIKALVEEQMYSSRISRSADHRYTYQGKTYPGTTSVIGVAINKSDALVPWSAKITAEVAVELLDTLPTLRASVGDQGVINALKAASLERRGEAAKLGSIIHGLADDFIQGRALPADMPELHRKYIDGYSEWWRVSGWSLRASEALLVNPEWGYGGTLDLLARDRDGATVLADIKTGKGVYREAVLQLTAYGAAQLIQTEAGVFAMPHVDRYVILHVTADGVREVEVNVTSLEQVAWGACLDLYQWTESTKGKRL